jgi:hypothetical protein
MKSLKICLSIFAGLLLLGGMVYVWNACGSLKDLCFGLALMALVVFGWPA